MNPPTRIAVHLAVIGCALVTAAVRPSHPSVATGDAAQPTRASTADAPNATVVAVVREAARMPAKAARHRAHRRHPQTGAVAAHRSTTHAHHAATRRSTTRRTSSAYTGPTGWRDLNRAIAMIPTYRPGLVRWTVSRRYGYWGTADWYHAVIYISPTVPTTYLYDVAVHEWSHELSVLDYDGDVNAAVSAMDAHFGGEGLAGAERAADCMAILQGATWTHYTSCHNTAWRAAAARLVHGEQL